MVVVKFWLCVFLYILCITIYTRSWIFCTKVTKDETFIPLICVLNVYISSVRLKNKLFNWQNSSPIFAQVFTKYTVIFLITSIHENMTWIVLDACWVRECKWWVSKDEASAALLFLFLLIHPAFYSHICKVYNTLWVCISTLLCAV